MIPVLVLLASSAARGQQVPDSSYHPAVAHPAYDGRGPRVAIDAGHLNMHTAEGGYGPFAELLRRDGYRVGGHSGAFTAASLADVDVLVIANARGAMGPAAFSTPAFTPEECRAVRAWVEGGGSLLLIADHAPFGGAAEGLAREFGVEMGKGFTLDTTPGTFAQNPSSLLFTRENGLLGAHPILEGRDSTERVSRVLTFTGQSLSVPPGATALLRLSPTARDRAAPTRDEAEARQRRVDSLVAAIRAGGARDSTLVLRTPLQAGPAQFTSAAGRAQGVALEVGRGRVVILGEAAMLSAQVVRIPGMEERRMGMNVPGSDDRQFALNILHWLSRLY